MQTLILEGEPKSTGSIYRSMCRGNFPSTYMTNEGKALKESYQWQAKSQWKNKPLTGDLEIDIKIFFGTKRKSDWDNFHKLSMDSLTGTVWVDDSQVQRAIVEKHYDKNNPRIEIIVKTYEEKLKQN